MSISTVFKRAALAATVAVSTLSLQAMAGEDGKCNTNMAINYLVPPKVTPQLVEQLRTAYGAQEVRIERPGEAHTKEFNPFRLRLLVNEDNFLNTQICG